MKTKTFFYFERQASGTAPAGVTVSKTATLPIGDFAITEFVWGRTTLWFIDSQQFTADERQDAYRGAMKDAAFRRLAAEGSK